MTLPQFILWLSVAFFSGMLATGLICVAILQVWMTCEEVDELCDCGGEEV